MVSFTFNPGLIVSIYSCSAVSRDLPFKSSSLYALNLLKHFFLTTIIIVTGIEINIPIKIIIILNGSLCSLYYCDTLK